MKNIDRFFSLLAVTCLAGGYLSAQRTATVVLDFSSSAAPLIVDYLDFPGLSANFSPRGTVTLELIGRFGEVASPYLEAVRLADLELVISNTGQPYSPVEGVSYEGDLIVSFDNSTPQSAISLTDATPDGFSFSVTDIPLQVKIRVEKSYPWLTRRVETPVPATLPGFSFSGTLHVDTTDSRSQIVAADVSFDYTAPGARGLDTRFRYSGTLTARSFRGLPGPQPFELLRPRPGRAITVSAGNPTVYFAQTSIDGGTTWQTFGAPQVGPVERTFVVPEPIGPTSQVRLVEGILIDFETLPGIDGILGTDDDIPTPPGTTNLDELFRNVGFVEDRDFPISGWELFIEDNGIFADAPPENHYVRMAGAAFFTFTRPIPVFGVDVASGNTVNALTLFYDRVGIFGQIQLELAPADFTPGATPAIVRGFSVNAFPEVIESFGVTAGSAQDGFVDNLILPGETSLPLDSAGVSTSRALVFELYTAPFVIYDVESSPDGATWSPLAGFQGVEGDGSVLIIPVLLEAPAERIFLRATQR